MNNENTEFEQENNNYKEMIINGTKVYVKYKDCDVTLEEILIHYFLKLND